MPKIFFIVLLIVLMFSLLFTGCYDAVEIDDEIYAVSIGIDKGVNNKLRITIQYPTYKGGSEGSDGQGAGGGSQTGNVQEGSNVHTIEAPTILEGMDMLSMAISRRVSLIHAKWVIFSEEFARSGISSYLGALQRFQEIRTTMSVLITKGKAEDFIKENKSNIGSSLSKSIELFLLLSDKTGFFPEVRLSEFYRNIQSTYRQPIALYGGVNDFKILEDKYVEEPPLVTGEGFLPEELPRRGVAKRELVGIAVFNGSKMVGSLDSYETTYYLMISGEFKSGKVSIPDKYNTQQAIVFDVHVSRKPKVKAYFEKDKVIIDTKLTFDAEIFSIQSRINYEEISMTDNIENQLKDYLLKGMKETIRKTQEEFGTDIFGFGDYVANKFFTIGEWENFNWLSHYKEAVINVDLDVAIRRTGLRFYSAPFFNNKGIEEVE